MHIFIDIVIVAMLVFCAIKYYRQGFLCSCLHFGKFVVAVLFSVIFGRPLGDLFADKLIGPATEASVSLSLINMISGILAYVLIYTVTLTVLHVVIRLLSKIKIPIITNFDKLLGLTLGLVVGIFSVSLLSTVAYSLLEFMSSLGKSELMNIYYDSYVFKFVYDLNIFEFVRNLIQ